MESRIPNTITYRGQEISLYEPHMMINEIIIQSIDDILPFVSTDVKYSFRGQASSDWPLKSSIERLFDDRGILHNRSIIENAILSKYRSEFSIFSNQLGYDPNTQSTMDSLSDIQHYGGPTRFLDWTSSFNIGLFFATFNNYKYDFASVYCLRNIIFNVATLDLRDLLQGQPMAPGVEETLPEPLDKKKLLQIHIPNRKNARIINQQGYFIYPGSVDFSYEESLSYSLDLPLTYHQLSSKDVKEAILRSTLIKIKIPKNLIREIRKYLKQSGISMKGLFPDYYGAIQSLYELEDGFLV